MDHSCHVFRSGSPGGTLRPPLPFFPVWAHRVGPFGPPSHFFWCGRTLWRAMRVVPFLSAMDASKVIPEKPIEHPHNTRRRPADVAAFQCPHNTRRHPADVAVIRHHCHISAVPISALNTVVLAQCDHKGHEVITRRRGAQTDEQPSVPPNSKLHSAKANGHDLTA